MSGAAAFVWTDELVEYDFGRDHPLAPIRVELAVALARSFGLLDRPSVSVIRPDPADDDVLRLVHEPGYIDAVRAAGDHGQADPARGLGSADNPVFWGMHEAAALVAGASVAAAQAIWRDGADHAVNLAGGLHHAMPGAASGFCIYNDPAIAIRWLLDNGVGRVAYVDVDVHHGDGVQHVFYDDPRVLTISIHESGHTLFPGTGFPGETGAPSAAGTAVNVALPAGTGDAGWLRAFHAVVPALVRAFAPDVLVSQQGCDSHALDPLAHLMLSVDGQSAAYRTLHDLAHEVCGGRWLATGGGGYELVYVVPRAWTHLVATATGEPVPAASATPTDWRELVRRRTGETAPTGMTDGRTADYPPFPTAAEGLRQVDEAIAATRAAVFPAHGLAP